VDIVQLYQDYGIDYITEGHKHARPGWANVECPFCTGNPGYHLGYNIEDSYFYCWRCGWHHPTKTISKLLNIDESATRKLFGKYGIIVPKYNTVSVQQTQKLEHRLPSCVEPLTKRHKQYLIKRGYDPERLQRMWNLMGTGPISMLDTIDFKHRIVIPIIWNSQQTSFTTRDITGKSKLRYITCPKNREIIPHKQIIYGKQEMWSHTGICVEGPADVWRFGFHAFCTFGIEYTYKQLQVMSKTFKRIVVIFDDDPQAVKQGDKLVADLRFRGVESFRLDCIVAPDPGSMRQSDADYLVKQLI